MIGLAVLAAGAVGACGGTSPATPPAATPSATASVGPTGTAAATASPAASATAAAAQAAPCAAADIKSTVIGQAQRTSGDTRMAIVELTNVSTRQCRLEGSAMVNLVDAADQPVQVPTVTVAQPGPPVPVDLPPGTSASEGIKWTVCDKASADCPTGNGLQVGLPGGTGGRDAELSELPAAESSDITMKSLQVGTVQPSAQGVVAW